MASAFFFSYNRKEVQSMYWIERLEQVDEDDPNSEQVWVLYSVTCYKEIAFRYMQMSGFRVTKHEGV